MKAILLPVLIMISISTAFAQSPSITIDVNNDQFIPGEIIELNGAVEKQFADKPVAVEIKDSSGNIILIRTVTPDSDGNFTLKFKIPSSVESGKLEIITNIETQEETVSETKTIQTVVLEPEPICGAGTILKDNQCVPEQQTTVQEKESQGGGCLIATATFGSELAPQVQQLRELRDNKLLQTESGSAFMQLFNDFYYSFSPGISDYERENPVFKEAVKIAITPMISSLSVLNYVEMSSDREVLRYGISLILLNVGMYVGIPAVVIVGIRKRF